MFILKGVTGTIKYLFSDNKYTVGRRNSDICLSKDASVSRRHAELEVEEDVITVTDCNSKYYTSINEWKIQIAHPKTARHGDTIHFGVYDSKFRVEKVEICTTTSNVDQSTKIEIKLALKQLSGRYVSQWNSCTHLTASNEFSITAKVLHAILDNKPIVKPEFWKKYVENISKDLPPPEPSNYFPSVTEGSFSASEFKYNPNRAKLFKNKIFVFTREEENNKLGEIIIKTGGKSTVWENATVSLENLKNTPDSYIFIEGDVDKIPPKILNHYTKMLNKRLVGFHEIVLAIMQGTAKTNCNPSLDIIKEVFVPGTPKVECSDTAQESEFFTPENPDIKSNIIFSETQRTDSFVVPSTLSSFRVKDEKKVVVGPDDETQDFLVSQTLKNHEEVENPSKKIKLEITEKENLPVVQKNPIKRTEVVSSLKFVKTPAKRPIERIKENSPPPKRLSTEKINPFANLGTIAKSSPNSNLVINPFRQAKQNNNSRMLQIKEETDKTPPSSKRENIFSAKRPAPEAINEKDTQVKVRRTADLSRISSVLDESAWLSKTDCDLTNDIKVEDVDEEMQAFVDVFNNSMVVRKVKCVKKQLDSSVYLGDVSEINFKKFKKAQIKIPEERLVLNSTVTPSLEAIV